jgi:hypothetical protein
MVWWWKNMVEAVYEGAKQAQGIRHRDFFFISNQTPPWMSIK